MSDYIPFQTYDPNKETLQEYYARREEWKKAELERLRNPDKTKKVSDYGQDVKKEAETQRNSSRPNWIKRILYPDQCKDYPKQENEDSTPTQEQNSIRAIAGSNQQNNIAQSSDEWHLWASDGKMHREPEPHQEGTGEWYLTDDGEMKRR